MVIEKRYRRHLLLTSAVLATAVFLAGILFGWSLDHFRTTEILTTIKQNELSTESYLVEQQFIDSFGGDKCELLTARVDTLRDSTNQIGKQLACWGGKSTFKEADFDYLKRKYTILEVRFLMLINDLKQECGQDYNIILSFYKIDEDASIRQGYVLDSLNDKYNNTLIILSFDKYYTDEPLIDILATRYGIERTPAIVVNGKVKQGFVPESELDKLIKSQ